MVKFPCALTEHTPRRRIAGVNVQLHVFLTLTLYGGEWTIPGTHRQEAGLDAVVKRKIPSPYRD
jgi:hypothetical protein